MLTAAEAFTPWFKLIVNALLFPLWTELLDARGASGQLDARALAHRADDQIHRM